MEERIDREKKLVKAFDRKTTSELRKRLRRAASRLHVPENSEPLAVTLQRLAQLSSSKAPLTERMLHQYRILGKRARYIAELANEDAAATKVVDELKHMQDVLGNWHDWLKLTERAEELLGGVSDSAFVAMLRNVTQAKFRQSLDAVAEVREKFAGKDVGAKRPAARAAVRKAAA
jgi:CHAD domain-containing protein